MSHEVVRIESGRFGLLEVPEAELLRFPGLPGFPAARRFALVEHDERGIFGWLVSADVPDLAFVVTNPWNFVPDYDPAVPERAIRALGAQSVEELEILAIASFREGDLALNLAAPLVVHPKNRRGLQVILDGGPWPPRQVVRLSAGPEVREAGRGGGADRGADGSGA